MDEKRQPDNAVNIQKENMIRFFMAIELHATSSFLSFMMIITENLHGAITD